MKNLHNHKKTTKKQKSKTNTLSLVNGFDKYIKDDMPQESTEWLTAERPLFKILASIFIFWRRRALNWVSQKFRRRINLSIKQKGWLERQAETLKIYSRWIEHDSLTRTNLWGKGPDSFHTNLLVTVSALRLTIVEQKSKWKSSEVVVHSFSCTVLGCVEYTCIRHPTENTEISSFCFMYPNGDTKQNIQKLALIRDVLLLWTSPLTLAFRPNVAHTA